jgi:hypothetical protein
MKSILAFIAANVFLFSFNGAAETEIGNGGDPIALEFQNSAQIAIKDIQGDLADYPSLKGVDLGSIFAHTLVLVTDTPLYVTSGVTTQESTAINHHNPDTVVINRASWERIENFNVRDALALHEILGLAGIEGTGNYSVSQVYLNRESVPCSQDLCESAPAPSHEFDFAFGAREFENSDPPTETDIEGHWVMGGRAVISGSGTLFGDYSGYSDGVFYSGKLGPVQEMLTIEESQDVFGNASLSLDYGLSTCQLADNRTLESEDTDVSIDPHGAYFALNKNKADTEHIAYECRLAPMNVLVCAVTLTEAGADNQQSLQSYLGKVVIYKAYKNID